MNHPIRREIEITDGRGAVASEVRVQRGLDGLLPPSPTRTVVAVLGQSGSHEVADRVCERLGTAELLVHRRTLPDGDDAKRWEVVAGIHEWLAEIQLGRGDTVVGVGGGAATDVAGFVAATWLRGVEVVQVPTTLLAAVDAAIGGKTGINVRGKNLVGAFWHPSRVVVDLDVLDRLPPALKLDGFAETLKAGYVADPRIVELFVRDGREVPLDEVVPRAIAVKAGVVSADFREAGRRAVLNFGHTVGHAVELAAGLTHGQAVAVGMVAAAAASRHRFGHAIQIAPLVERLGLPVGVEGVERDTVEALMSLDKKRDRSGVRMILLRAVGDPVVEAVDPPTIDVALAAVGIH